MKQALIVSCVLCGVAVAAIHAGCGGADCTTGRQTSCACPGAKVVGVQVCRDDGTYGPCQCEGNAGGGGAATTTTTTTGGGGTTTTSSAGGTGGTGGIPCDAPKVLCGDECVDLDIDDANCGACDHACPKDATCLFGECDCDGDQEYCGEVCVDTQNDGKNCGGCAHDCLGQTCADGLCPAEAMSIGTDKPYAIAIDATHLYWTSEGNVNKVFRRPLASGSAEELTAVQPKPRGLVLDAAGPVLYWTNFGSTGPTSAIGALPLPPGQASVLLGSLPAGAWGIAVHAGWLYWVNHGDDSITRVQITNPTVPQALATVQSTPTDIAVDNGGVYWTNNNGGDIRNVALGGGPQKVLASGQSSPFGVALDATHVYWSSQQGGEISRVPRAGGEVETLVVGQATPTYLRVAGNYVYWSNFGNGTLARAPVTGGTPTTLAAGQNQPYYLLVDGDYVYWTTLGGGTIMRAPK